MTRDLDLVLVGATGFTGQVTTAQAMGDALTGRLERAGVRFEVVS